MQKYKYNIKPDYKYKAKLIRVIDGDTIVITISLGFETQATKKIIRFKGINAPEKNRKKTKVAGLAAKKFVEERLNGAELFLETYLDKKGSFNRWLGYIWYKRQGKTRWVNLNQEMLDKKYAVKYNK